MLIWISSVELVLSSMLMLLSPLQTDLDLTEIRMVAQKCKIFIQENNVISFTPPMEMLIKGEIPT